MFNRINEGIRMELTKEQVDAITKANKDRFQMKYYPESYSAEEILDELLKALNE